MTLVPITPRRCYVCDRWVGEGQAERFALIDDPERDPVGEHTCWMCDSCVQEAEESRKYDSPLALLLWTVDQNGFADDFMGDTDGYGYFAQVGDYIMSVDSQGFVCAEGPYDPERMERKWDRYYSDGAGMSYGDYLVSYGWRNGYTAYAGSRDLGTYERESRALAAVSLEARRSGYYGPCWRVGERGDVSLVHYW